MQNIITEKQTINDLVKQRNMAHRELELKSISPVEPRWALLKTSIRSQHRDESILD